MLKQTRLFSRMLALGYLSLSWFKLFQFAFSTSLYQDFKYCSESVWISQNSRSIFFEIIRKIDFNLIKDNQKFPDWEN